MWQKGGSMSSLPTYDIFTTAKGSIHIKEMVGSMDAEVRDIIANNGIVLWHNNGEVRVLSNAILRDTFDTFDAWNEAKTFVIVDFPRDVGVFYWGDTHRLP
jgi:hypothetical protein